MTSTGSRVEGGAAGESGLGAEAGLKGVAEVDTCRAESGFRWELKCYDVSPLGVASNDLSVRPKENIRCYAVRE
jgi:hypothetical protein